MYRTSTMYRIHLTIVGKGSRGPLGELVEEYLKRVGPYARIEIHEIKEEAFRYSEDRPRVIREEGKRIESALVDDAFTIVLSAEGKGMPSEKFAEALDKWSEQEARPLQFVIGGPLGIDPVIKKRADLLLSLSEMTFPHDVARVLLLEQLYRAFTIQKGKTYHY